MFQTVIFDLDGTILNTLDDLAAAGNWVCRRNAWPEHSADAYRRMVGHGLLRLVEQFSPENFRSPLLAVSTLAQFNEYYRQHNMDATAPYRGISELLAQLKAAGCSLGVCSNKPDEFSQAIVSHYFPHTFQAVRGQRTGVPVKPDPTGVALLLKELHATPENTLFVGDSGVDIQTAHNAHLTACGVTWGFRSREDLLAAGAEHLADTAEALAEYILRG